MNTISIIAALRGLELMINEGTLTREQVTSILVNISNLARDEHVKIKITEMLVLDSDKSIALAANSLAFELEQRK